MRIRRAFAIGLLTLTPAFTGCLSHTRSVIKTHPPDVVLNATLGQLLQQTTDRFDAIHSMTLTVQMTVATGGSMKGQLKEYTNLKAYIVISKPDEIRLILLLPVLHSNMVDMVSNGKTFKMLITLPTESCAITGSDTVTNSAQKGLYALRPDVILDPLLIQGLRPDQLVSMTQDLRPGFPDPKKRKQLIEEPDYDLEFLSQPNGQVARSERVVHIGRSNLLPWRQDVYNADGKVETQAFYSNFKTFGDIPFPTKIVIQRPLDELGLTIAVTTATFNQTFPADEFKLDIPQSVRTTNMDDPANAATNPCGAHESQSPH